jgi:hypothetical protein
MKTLCIESINAKTEKAIQVIVGARRAQTGEFRNVKLWLPLSQIKVISDTVIELPEWLLDAKIEQVGNDYDFDCDALTTVGLEPSDSMHTKEENEAIWDTFLADLAAKEAKKEKARARKAAKKASTLQLA